MHAAIFCSVQRTISRAIGWLDGKGRISSSSSPSERGFTDWSSYKKEQESAAARRREIESTAGKILRQNRNQREGSRQREFFLGDRERDRIGKERPEKENG